MCSLFSLKPGAVRASLMAVGLAGLLFFTAARPLAQQTPDITSNNSTLTATDEVLKTVSRLRGLSVVHPVKSGFKSHDEIEQSVEKDLDDSTTPADFEATTKTLSKLGMIPDGFDIRPYMIKMLREQVAGYYDPKTKYFYLASWLPISEQKTVMAHELTHALQDQHFDLSRFDHWPKGDSDAELAAHALMEGEATIMMIEYSADESGYRLDVTRLESLTDRMLAEDSGSDSAHFPVLAAAPAVLRDNLQFPYVYGVGFIQQVLRAKSWSGIDNCYARLPASTKQIIHPESYLAQDNPTKVKLPELGSALGPGWATVDQDVNGEFGYQEILGKFIDKQTAASASAGWAGDSYELVENKKIRESILVQFSTWDTADNASDFFNAYTNRTMIRYGITDAGQQESNIRNFSTKQGLVLLERHGNDVVIIEGATGRQQLSKLSDLMWRSKKTPPSKPAV